MTPPHGQPSLNIFDLINSICREGCPEAECGSLPFITDRMSGGRWEVGNS